MIYTFGGHSVISNQSAVYFSFIEKMGEQNHGRKNWEKNCAPRKRAEKKKTATKKK